MNCRRVNSLLSAYIDGELAGVEQLQIRDHLRECADCSEEHESLLSTKRLLSGVRSAMPKTDLETRILARVAQERSTPRPLSRARAWWSVETPGWRLRLGFGTVGAAVALAALAAAVRPLPDGQLHTRSLAEMSSRPIAAEPDVPVGDIRMLHEVWQGPQAAGAHGLDVSIAKDSSATPQIQPDLAPATLADIGPR